MNLYNYTNLKNDYFKNVLDIYVQRKEVIS